MIKIRDNKKFDELKEKAKSVNSEVASVEIKSISTYKGIAEY